MLINIDEDIENADWLKKTWDLPEEDSDEFQEFLKSTEQTIEDFKNLPVYKYKYNINQIQNVTSEDIKEKEVKKEDITAEEAEQILVELRIDDITPEQLAQGMTVEMEHLDITDGDPILTAKIAIAHLNEDLEYYTKLEEFVENAIHIPVNSVDRNPSDAKLKAGNYKKAHIKLHGLDIAIENPRGTERRGVGKDGVPWWSILPAHYGYIKKTEGADGAAVDVFVGPHENSNEIYIVDQKDIDTNEFDEHKCIFGALSETQAKQLYLDSFSDNLGPKRLMAITPLTVEEFKQWLKEGDTTKSYYFNEEKENE